MGDEASGGEHTRERAARLAGWAHQLASPDRTVRRQALDQLAKVEAASAEAALESALGAHDAKVRAAAVGALAQLPLPRSIEFAIRALQDPGTDVRCAAIRVLQSLGDARAVEPLMVALSRGETVVRLAAVRALGQLGTPAAAPLIRALGTDLDEPAAEALSRIGEPALAPLLEALKDRDADIRRGAAWTLGLLGDPRALPALRRTLGAHEPKDPVSPRPRWTWMRDWRLPWWSASHLPDETPHELRQEQDASVRQACRDAIRKLQAMERAALRRNPPTGGRGTELEAACAPEGTGTELVSGAAPERREAGK